MNYESVLPNEDELIDFYLYPPTAIELVGYIKNHIIDVLQLEKGLPIQYEDKLYLCLSYLDDIEDFLYQN